jgi:hypothetical protein
MRRLLCLLILLVPATADARTVDKSRHLWATVNICDSAESPDTVGIRASMPGAANKRERMYMRFRVQFFDGEQQAWRDFASEGTNSGFVPVGSARFKARQSGWTFPFQLGAGQRYELRGVVNFQWRRGKRVVRRATKSTSPGHRTALSEPEGYSAATCVING